MSESKRVVFSIVKYIGDDFQSIKTVEDDIIKILNLCGVEELILNPSDPERSVTLSERLYLKFECTGKVVCLMEYQTLFETYTILQQGWNRCVPLIISDIKNRPWLSFRTDKAYLRKFKNAHKVDYGTVNIGTLVSSSSFVTHVVTLSNNISFYHDSRKIVISDGFEIRYFAIKNILVNGNQWVVHLLHPITVYTKRESDFDYKDEKFLGRSNAIFIKFQDKYDSGQILSRLHFTCRNFGLSINYVPFEVSHYCPEIRCNLNLATFETNYLVEAILRRSFAPELQGLEEIRALIIKLQGENSRVLNKTLQELIYIMDTGLIFDFKTAIGQLFVMKTKNEDTNLLQIIPEKTKLVRRAVITPTRILLYPPELVITNRIMRKFDIDSALRVSFRDDNLNKLSQSNGRHIDSQVISITVDKVRYGLHIGGRNFQFLAWSNSQIRDHGLWLYAMDSDGNTAKSIQRWMGDFSKIKVVAKYAARMGQCFSQTEEAITVPLSKGRVKTEPDIKGKGIDPESQEHYVFSDGVGKISKDLAEKVCEKLKISKLRSAFQIRYSGYKGMLVIDDKLTDYDIVFRESMKKFECESSETLEIVKIAQACVVTLNRPLVTILDQMGIEHSVFLKIQNETLQTYTDMLLNDEKAISYLKKHHNMPNVTFNEFTPSGIYPTIEPFFRAMLLVGHKFDIAQIMKKARIPIDPSDGRNMFGVLDETATLKYGEVFIQYTKNIIGQETNKLTEIVKGKVLVTKNPCYQPGDVRVLKAIDVPDLHHIVDCIVFPQKGIRPHPNEMSGSDLDGDEYTVIWKDDFIFKKPNARARHCPVAEKKEHPTPITDSDLLEFFKMFILNDKIGPLASAHLAVADSHGLYNQLCQLLARNCSVAVDFSKSGKAAESDDHIYISRYPDFMEKWDKITYRSERALGKLYRSSRAFARLSHRTPEYYENVEVDPLLIYTGWENYESDAIESRNKYNSFLESILINYGVLNESEAMIGLYSRLQGRFSVKNGRSEIEELVKILIKCLWRTFYHDFHKEFTDKPNSEEEVLKKASAWYIVTYRDTKPKYLSFPWIISNYLLEIKTIALANQTSIPEKPIINELEYLVEFKLGEINLLSNENESKNYVIEKAKKLVELWAKYNDVNAIEVLKLFAVAIQTDFDYRQSIVCLFEFFKFLINLSLQDKSEIEIKLNSYNCYLSQDIIESLGKEAMHSYQYIAVKKDLGPFGLSKIVLEKERIEMEPKTLSQDLVKNIDKTISQVKLNNLSSLLQRHSGVENIECRIENGKILIIAYGLPDKVEKLEDLIRKGSEWLITVL